ncbi:MAG: trimethylamine methyltransferase family protein [Rhodobacterales bacterium]|nr:trimethylamine methyltransferase family protein [Rhodobacterales bacterium]
MEPTEPPEGTPDAKGTGRRGRLSARRKARQDATAVPAAQPQRPRAQPVRRFPATPIVSEDALEAIHQASLTILEDLGIEFLGPRALDCLKAGGADVSGQMVRFDRALVDRHLKTVPETFTLHARNPDNNLVFGGHHVAFCMVASAPNVSGLDGGRRSGNQKDFRNLVRLGQSLNVIHMIAGYPVEPIDLPPRTRHLDCVADNIRLTDKPLYGYALGAERIHDSLEMTRIALGLTEAQVRDRPCLTTVINANSPRRYDGPMTDGLMAMAEAGQVNVITPFTLAGAMAPVTVAGAVAQQNAEALAGIVLAQMVRPGAPVVYGGFTSNVDMRSGAPAFGTPEYMQSSLLTGQLIRRYRMPYRSSNASTGNAVDAQAAYESVFSLWGAVMGGAHMIKHAAGWMEGGLCANYEKVILDAELLQTVAAFLDPIAVDEPSLALSAQREVAPGGHFFGAEHTKARYATAFYDPILSNWQGYEAWLEDGMPEAAGRANAIAKRLLAEYQPPPLDPAIDAELEAFVARRKAEGGVSE